MMPAPPTWHWGAFVVYGIGCFIAALLMGLLGIPGPVVVAIGVIVGLWAAWGRWFELRGPSR